jgi:arylsulfatase A-like enzyme
MTPRILLPLLGWLLAGTVSFGQAAAPAPAPAAAAPAPERPVRPIPAVEHVLIVSVDGLRPDKVLQANAPTMRAMMKDGAYTMWARTTYMANTLPSHTSMVTGVSIGKHGIYWNEDLPLSRPVYPDVPTVMELATRAGYATAMVAGKSKFATLNKPGTIGHVYVPAGANSKDNNDTVVAEAAKIIEATKPELMFLHFPDTDTVGHASGWGSPQFLAAVEKTDTQLAAVFAALDRAGIRQSTVVILSADHGGQGTSHGAEDERSRNIPWIVTGPGVRVGYDLTSNAALSIRTEDTAATALWLLGLNLPANLDGRPVNAAFPSANPAPARGARRGAAAAPAVPATPAAP